MKKICSLIILLFLLVELCQAQQSFNNSLEINSFRNLGSNTNGFERHSVNGLSVGYTRYLFNRLNIGAAFGWGEYKGRGTYLLERFDDFSLDRNYRQYQIKLGYDLVQTKRLNLGFQAEYLRFYYNSVSLIIATGQMGTSDYKENLSFGRLATPSFFIGPYGMFHLTKRIAVKGDLAYGMPSMNFDYRWYRFSFGLGYRF